MSEKWITIAVVILAIVAIMIYIKREREKSQLDPFAQKNEEEIGSWGNFGVFYINGYKRFGKYYLKGFDGNYYKATQAEYEYQKQFNEKIMI